MESWLSRQVELGSTAARFQVVSFRHTVLTCGRRWSSCDADNLNGDAAAKYAKACEEELEGEARATIAFLLSRPAHSAIAHTAALNAKSKLNHLGHGCMLLAMLARINRADPIKPWCGAFEVLRIIMLPLNSSRGCHDRR